MIIRTTCSDDTATDLDFDNNGQITTRIKNRTINLDPVTL